MTEFNPKVSIVIPVYNGANYLAEAIDSALAQTYRNTEVIVVNDGSTDSGKTEEIALSYGDRIRYFRKENGGVSSALNLGLREMAGDYFSWLSHDDVYYPDKLAVQIKHLRERGEDVILYGDYDLIGPNSVCTGKTRLPHLSPHEVFVNLVIEHPINGCTTLVPRRCFEKVGVFNEALKTTQDYDLWMRMAPLCPFVHLAHPFIKSRIHPHQGSVTMSELMHREQHELFVGYLDVLAASDDPDTPYALLNNALHMVKNKFPEAGAYGFDAARRKLGEGGATPLRGLWLMGYYLLLSAALKLYRAKAAGGR